MNSLNNIFNIEEKVVVITGGAGYLCSEIAYKLHLLKCTIIILDNDIEKGKHLEEKINKEGGKSLALKIDVKNKDNYASCAETIIKLFDKIDILINGAGINSPTPLLDIKEEEWDNIVATHLKGTLFSCQIFGKEMIKQKKGSIINFSSASSGPPLSKAFAYSVAKAGIKNLTQNIAREWAIYNVRINSLKPGFFPTEWSKKNFIDKDREKAILSHTPMNRFGEPDELLGAIIWLSSDAASFVTGAEIAIDGGFSAMTI
tara:strand:+ start:490 stop:1266 length:777 start_codon:yes stop_codon:yes gene_type:complete